METQEQDKLTLLAKINLLKLRNAVTKKVKLPEWNESKDCIIIPVDDAWIYSTQKGVFLDILISQYKEPQFGFPYYVKQQIDFDRYSNIPASLRFNIPFLGNAKRFSLVKKDKPKPKPKAEPSNEQSYEEEMPF